MADCVHIIATGGTIDSAWDGKLDSVVVSEHSVFPQYFRDIKLRTKINFTEVCMKDSRALTSEDLKALLKAIEESPETKILITHGLYTMPDTARFLKSKLKRRDQVIVLTGSMTPLKGFGFSDAAFNLGFAFAKLFDLQPGVYICINGEVFSSDELTKNLAEGKFFSVFEEKQ